jgi:hypothetical protein
MNDLNKDFYSIGALVVLVAPEERTGRTNSEGKLAFVKRFDEEDLTLDVEYSLLPVVVLLPITAPPAMATRPCYGSDGPPPTPMWMRRMMTTRIPSERLHAR